MQPRRLLPQQPRAELGDHVQSEGANRIQSYRLTTIRSTPGRHASPADRVRMLGGPQIGRPMVMFGGDGNRRIVTSPVVRVFDGTEGRGTYVETRNTLYFLESR